jgi:hypothetical protein
MKMALGILDPLKEEKEKRTMKTNRLLIVIGLIAAMLVAGCSAKPRVGALRTESQSVELGGAKSLRVEIAMGAGDLHVTGGAERLLEADFNYNVDALKPILRYSGGKLVLRQPEVSGMPSLSGIGDFRNQWDLRLYDDVPMDLNVDVGAGSGDLKLAGLSLTGLSITVGAGEYIIDLSGDWARDLDIAIDAGAAFVSLRLPRNVGVRVDVEDGPHTTEATGLTQDGGVYTNAAYGVSDVTLQVHMTAGIGRINLDVEEAAAMQAQGSGPRAPSQLVQAGVEEAGITGRRTALVDVE